ncbi:MAG: GatB/YqeY domain-containing protein [Granulosicoccaceae bacterium]|jgi:uncharacterized protein YqeY
MSDTTLKDQLGEAMKAAMRAKDKNRLGVIRLIQAAIKQKEVDERIELDDTAVLAVLDKMLKQRRDSIKQYTDAGRTDLADQEEFEVGIIQEYMPAQLTDDEINAIIDAAIAETGASSMKEMGQVMGKVRPQVQGRADMGAVSGLIKARLGG